MKMIFSVITKLASPLKQVSGEWGGDRYGLQVHPEKTKYKDITR